MNVYVSTKILEHEMKVFYKNNFSLSTVKLKQNSEFPAFLRIFISFQSELTQPTLSWQG